jgi:hypothetical protein
MELSNSQLLHVGAEVRLKLKEWVQAEGVSVNAVYSCSALDTSPGIGFVGVSQLLDRLVDDDLPLKVVHSSPHLRRKYRTVMNITANLSGVLLHSMENEEPRKGNSGMENYVAKGINISCRTIDGAAYIYDQNTKMLLKLDEIGSFIWDQINGLRKIEQISILCQEEFSGDISDIQLAVQEFVNELNDKGVVVLSTCPYEGVMVSAC